MSTEEVWRHSFVLVEVNDEFTEAKISMRDGSKVCFCHRVGERRAWAVSTDETATATDFAIELLAKIRLFRLNAKHLEVQFEDGTRWEARFRN
jgi:hypothetical protein